MDLALTVKKMSRKMKRSFPLVPLEDLESEAYLYLLSSDETNPATKYVNEEWRLYHYATMYAVGMRQCSSDAEGWLDLISVQDETSRQSNMEALILLSVDVENELSGDALFVVDQLLAGELLDTESKYKTVSRQLVKDNLVKLGWNVQRTRDVVLEIKNWWGGYYATA